MKSMKNAIHMHCAFFIIFLIFPETNRLIVKRVESILKLVIHQSKPRHTS